MRQRLHKMVLAHTTELPAVLQETEELTFHHDIELVLEGLQEFIRTGHIPNIEELTAQDALFRKDVLRAYAEYRRQKALSEDA